MSNLKPATPKDYPKFWLSQLSAEALAAKLPYPVEFKDQSVRFLLSKPHGLVGQLTLVFAAYSLSTSRDKMNDKMHQLLLKLGVKITGLEGVLGQDLLVSDPPPRTTASAPEVSSLDDDLLAASDERTDQRGTVRPTEHFRRDGASAEGEGTAGAAPPPVDAATHVEAADDYDDPVDREVQGQEPSILPEDGDEETPEEKRLRLLRRLREKRGKPRSGSHSAHSISSDRSSIQALRDDLNGFKTSTTEVLGQILDAVAKLSGNQAQGQKRPPPAPTGEPSQKSPRIMEKDRTSGPEPDASRARFNPPAPAPWTAPAPSPAAEAAEEDFVGQVSPLF